MRVSMRHIAQHRRDQVFELLPCAQPGLAQIQPFQPRIPLAVIYRRLREYPKRLARPTCPAHAHFWRSHLAFNVLGAVDPPRPRREFELFRLQDDFGALKISNLIRRITTPRNRRAILIPLARIELEHFLIKFRAAHPLKQHRRESRRVRVFASWL